VIIMKPKWTNKTWIERIKITPEQAVLSCCTNNNMARFTATPTGACQRWTASTGGTTVACPLPTTGFVKATCGMVMTPMGISTPDVSASSS